MNTVAQIQAALPELTPGELFEVEMMLREVRRSRTGGVLMDDDYGMWTEEDQLSAAAEALAVLDEQPANDPAAKAR